MSARTTPLPTVDVGDGGEEDTLFGMSKWPAVYLIVFAVVFFIGGCVCVLVCCVAAKKRQRRRRALGSGRGGVEPLGSTGGARESFMEKGELEEVSRVSKVTREDTDITSSGRDRARSKLLTRDLSDSSSNMNHRYSDDDDADDWRYGEGGTQGQVYTDRTSVIPITQRGLYASPSERHNRGGGSDGPMISSPRGTPMISSPRGTHLGMWDRGRSPLGEPEPYLDDIDMHVEDDNVFGMHTTLATKDNITQVFSKIWDAHSDVDNDNDNDDDALLPNRERLKGASVGHGNRV